MQEIEGNLQIDKKAKIAIVMARFNSLVVDNLLKGALDALVRQGQVLDENIEIIKVPGAFELGFATKRALSLNKYDGILTLGAVIRGDTPHFEAVVNGVTKSIASLNLDAKIPIAFGVLTTDSTEQALERSGIKSGNKGFECALSLLEMISLNKKFK